MKTNLILSILFCLFIYNTFGQSTECATEFVHAKLMQEDTGYRNKMLTLASEINIIQNTSRLSSNVGIYTIPVVVHIIHLGEAVGSGTNISDAQVCDAITGLNNYWRKFVGDGVDMEIEFCLATRDPNGNATTGINRVNGSGITNYATQGITVPGCSTGAVEDNVKALSRWPVSKYYNIWVVGQICQGQWGGWSYYPFGGVNDGTVIIPSLMRSSSSILAHEVGHGFFLYHTFEGDGGNVSCPANTTCTSDGDKICDTPPHKVSDCGSTNVCTATGIWENTRYNYMSYCSGLTRFTQGQKDRVRAVAIATPRLSLLSSTGCSSVSTGINLTSNHTFIIFPNPGNGKFHLENAALITDIRILNLLGESVYQFTGDLSKIDEIDISSQPKGIYFLQVMKDGKMFSKELIVQ